MEIDTLQLGSLGVNCYIIRTGNDNCIVIDIGGESEKLLQYLKEYNLNLKKIILTHGHCDHIAGVADVQEATGAEVYIHEADADMMTDVQKNLGYWILMENETFKPITKYTTIKEGDIISQDNCNFKILNTPGHTPGSICILCDRTIFTGDTLFYLSRGRTDFPGGSDRQMLESLRRLKHLDGDYFIYPGHNMMSQLQFERENNPCMKGIK
ncbi:MAG: MBL fold metallo-hydrolase [Ruminococcus sp.]|nr:MBL fold metallo-hydrolase [Ruminococcus sp.]